MVSGGSGKVMQGKRGGRRQEIQNIMKKSAMDQDEMVSKFISGGVQSSGSTGFGQ